MTVTAVAHGAFGGSVPLVLDFRGRRRAPTDQAIDPRLAQPNRRRTLASPQLAGTPVDPDCRLKVRGRIAERALVMTLKS